MFGEGFHLSTSNSILIAQTERPQSLPTRGYSRKRGRTMLNDFPREMMAIWALPVRKEEKKTTKSQSLTSVSSLCVHGLSLHFIWQQPSGSWRASLNHGVSRNNNTPCPSPGLTQGHADITKLNILRTISYCNGWVIKALEMDRLLS
jgi:hypothetical protein